MSIPLSKLQPGQTGTIVTHRSEGAIRQRLMDLGLVPGRSLTLVRRAPLRDPIEVAIDGTHIIIRQLEAQTIHLQLAKGDN